MKPSCFPLKGLTAIALEVFAYEESLIEKGDCFQRFVARKPINGKNVPVILPKE